MRAGAVGSSGAIAGGPAELRRLGLTVLLIGWSLLEGLGAALIMPAIVALVASNFGRVERPRAYGLVAASGAIEIADLMSGDAKVAGILLERSGDKVVAGFGVNLAAAPEIEGRTTAALGAAVTPQAFAPLLAASFARLLGAWRSATAEGFARAWLERAHPLGTPLEVHSGPGERIAGSFDGIDADRGRGLLRQRFDFRRDHGKAFACFAGARGLDGRVERQQVGLGSDALNQRNHLADLLRRLEDARADGHLDLARRMGKSRRRLWVTVHHLGRTRCHLLDRRGKSGPGVSNLRQHCWRAYPNAISVPECDTVTVPVAARVAARASLRPARAAARPSRARA